MTDPNLPPERIVVEEPRHTTVNVQPERRGGGAGLAFVVGGLLVLAAIIAFFVFGNGGTAVKDAADTNVDVDVNLPDLPQAPKLPEAPTLPPVEPPTLPSPGPSPTN